MKRFGVAGTVSLIVAALGVILFILATTGLLFEQPTPWNDIGLWSVMLVLFAIGGFGFWASMAEKRQRERGQH
jgi:hypothetical protein